MQNIRLSKHYNQKQNYTVGYCHQENTRNQECYSREAKAGPGLPFWCQNRADIMQSEPGMKKHYLTIKTSLHWANCILIEILKHQYECEEWQNLILWLADWPVNQIIATYYLM